MIWEAIGFSLVFVAFIAAVVGLIVWSVNAFMDWLESGEEL